MKFIILFLSLTFLIIGCKKFVDVDEPKTQLLGESIFTSDATAHAAQLAIYTAMESDLFGYHIILYPGLSADELINYSSAGNLIDLSSVNLTPENSSVQSFWTNLYKYIYQANNILEGVSASTKLSETTAKQLTGEAKFIRAFCHFYLTRFYGEIPIVNLTDYRITSQLPRRPENEVADFIESDLNDAVQLLPDYFTGGTGAMTTERVRPTRSAALALLARVKLYRNDWIGAENNATSVINNPQFSIVTDMNNVFLKNSKEAILQWMGVSTRTNTPAGAGFILTTTPSASALDSNLVKSFNPIDKRKANWLKSIIVGSKTYWFAYKYKQGNNTTTITEYTMVLRLAEQYLIRAEACARQGKLDEALSDLNVIRGRAGLPDLNNLTQQAIIDSIQQERRYELFTEFGDRWLNLRRMGSIDPIMSANKGLNWQSTDALYPIPQTEINRNSNLTQNAGY